MSKDLDLDLDSYVNQVRDLAQATGKISERGGRIAGYVKTGFANILRVVNGKEEGLADTKSSGNFGFYSEFKNSRKNAVQSDLKDTLDANGKNVFKMTN